MRTKKNRVCGAMYALLQVPSNASQQDIAKAYRKAALASHPDRSGCAEAFRAVQEAYETLKEPLARHRYDLSLPWRGPPARLACRLETRAEGDVCVVSWGADLPGTEYVLRMRQWPGQDADWKVVYQGLKRKVAVRHLAPGEYEFSCFCLGGPAESVRGSVPDRLGDAVEALKMRGLSDKRARALLALHGNSLDLALADLMGANNIGKERRRKKKKKKKKEKQGASPEEDESKVEESAVDMTDEVLDVIKCSRCKVVVSMEEVADHVCDEGRVIMLRIVALERAHGVS